MLKGKSEQSGGPHAQIGHDAGHRNENKSNAPARTVELLIMDKDKPQNNPVPTD
jgi:hypothetical protein